MPIRSALALLALGFGLAAVAAAPERRPEMPLEDIERGQHGYGYTVFNGTEPERFEVEVLGILRHSQPGASYVIARLSGHDLETSGVAAGMSGSPVYIDDRLVGAVAFSWPYAKEAIAGITPIANMRGIAELPSGLEPPAGQTPRPRPRLELDQVLRREVPEDWMQQQIAQLAPPRTAENGAVTAAVEWVAAGFGANTRALLASSLGSVGTLGSGSSTTPGELVDGGPVAGVLISGDYQLSAVGTVTERHGDEVLAFGHAFLGLGSVAIPMAAAEVVTFMPSSYSSFKIANVGARVGVFEQDHQWGIRGRIGQTTPMIPLTVRIDGVRTREFHTDLANLETYVSALVSSVLAGAVESAATGGGPQTVDLDARIRLRGHEDLVVRQSFAGERAPGIAVNWLTGVVGFLATNDFEAVTFEGLEVNLHQRLGGHGLTLEAARPARSAVRPGDQVPISLDFRGYRGELERRQVQITVPLDAPAGKITLYLGDAASIDATRLSLDPVVPRNLADALELLGSYHSSRDLAVLAAFPAVGIQAGGRSMARLPGSIQSIWKGAGSAVAMRPLKSAARPLLMAPMGDVVAGLVRFDLDVRRPEPQPAEAPKSNGRNRRSNQE